MRDECHYWDTSAILASIFLEKESPKVAEWIERAQGGHSFSSFFTWVELESAFHRRFAAGEIAFETFVEFRAKSRAFESTVTTIWPDSWLLGMARRGVGEYGLRPGDALQLASALLISEKGEPPVFASLDRHLSGAARAAGLRIPS